MLQDKLQQFKDAYQIQSQYLSGITEKSEEESAYTNKVHQTSAYMNQLAVNFISQYLF